MPDQAALSFIGDRRIVITGASSWLGRALLQCLTPHVSLKDFGRIHLFGSTKKWVSWSGPTAGEIEQKPIRELADLKQEPTVVFHLAHINRAEIEQLGVDVYMKRSMALTAFVQQRLKPIGADVLFYPSSGAAVVPSTPYGKAKSHDEGVFRWWAEASNARLVIPRIYNLSGPYIPPGYALSNFILATLAGRPIQVTTPAPTFRSYTSVTDLFCAVLRLKMILDVYKFDVAGEEIIEIGDLARRVRGILGRRMAIERPGFQPEPIDRYVGNIDSFRHFLAETQVRPMTLDAQIKQTANYLARTR